MYLSQITQFDLIFVISILRKHIADSRLDYWHASKKVLQYLQEIMFFGLKYSLNIKHYKASYSRPGLISYADSNYISEMKSRRLTIGYIYCLNRVAVFWSKKRAKTVIVFLTEEEYVLLSNALKQAKRFINNF